MGKSKPLKFEQAIEQIEQIIEQIETGEVGLEDAIQRTEDGMKLIKHCRAILDRAETRIAELTATAEGDLESDEQDLDEELDEEVDEAELDEDEQ